MDRELVVVGDYITLTTAFFVARIADRVWTMRRNHRVARECGNSVATWWQLGNQVGLARDRPQVPTTSDRSTAVRRYTQPARSLPNLRCSPTIKIKRRSTTSLKKRIRVQQKR